MKINQSMSIALFMMSIPFAYMTSAVAENEAPHQAKHQEMPGSDMPMKPVSKECQAHMKEMKAHMKEMQAEMKAIHTESDPDKRKQLMQRHQKSMMKGMGMMHEMGGNMMSDKESMHGKQGCSSMMEERMDMMQMMMEQMMQHQGAQQDLPDADKHDH